MRIRGAKLSHSKKSMYNLKKIVYFWLCWVSVAAQAFSLVAEGRSSSPGALRGLLTVAASLVAERGLWLSLASVGAACVLSSCCSRALEPGLSNCGTWA